MTRTLLALATTLALTGCSAPAGPAPETQASPTTTPSHTAGAEASEGCTHLAAGPAKTLNANAPTMSVTPPAVDNDHHRYDIQLPTFEGQQQGTVSFNSDEAGEYHFYLNADVPFVIRGLADAPATQEAAASVVSSCDAVKGFRAVELGVGVYFLEFGPTTASSVGLVIEEASHESHDHE